MIETIGQRLSGRIMLVSGVLLGASGCGPERPETIPVAGTVTFGGGPPPAGGRVNYQPLETAGDLPRRPGSGRFGADGRFRVESFEGTDGLVPGRYAVQIECLSGPPAPVPGGYEAASHVPADYRPPDLVVPPGSPGIEDLRYQVPRN
jgi:hypothetical protein